MPKEASPHLLLGSQDQRLGAEQDQLPCRSTGTHSGTCQETETCMVQACHMSQQPLQNYPSGYLGGWTCRGWQRKCWMDNVGERIYPCPTACQNCLQWPSVRKTGRGSQLNQIPPPPPPHDLISEGTELSWTANVVQLQWQYTLSPFSSSNWWLPSDSQRVEVD